MSRFRPMSRGAILSALFLSLTVVPAVLNVPASAQSVPLPNPAPEPKTTGSIAPASRAAKPAQPTGPATTPAAQRNAPAPPPVASNPFAALFGKMGATTAVTPEQRAVIDRVSGYLSSVQVLTGNFVQVGPDGGRTQGMFYILKPGKVRFEYDAPSPIELIADGESVVVRDRRLATQDLYPLSQTPLRFLLAERINLLKDTNLVAVYVDDVFVTTVIEEKHGIVGTSRLMIMFSAKDMQLKQWTVTDPQGYDTTVAVYNLDTSKRPDPKMFKIDYTRNLQ